MPYSAGVGDGTKPDNLPEQKRTDSQVKLEGKNAEDGRPSGFGG